MSNLEHRLELLERKARWLTRSLILMTALLGCTMFTAAGPVPKERTVFDDLLVRNTLVIGSERGPVVRLEAGEDSAEIGLVDAKGQPRLVHTVRDLGVGSILSDKNGKMRIASMIHDKEDKSSVYVKSRKGNDALYLFAEGEAHGIVIYDTEQTPQLILGTSGTEVRTNLK
jgi:hypothetical protein